MFRPSHLLFTITFIFGLLLVSVQGQAMHHWNYINFLFDPATEAPIDTDVIAEVTITDIDEGSKFLVATVHIDKIIKTSDTLIRQGDEIALKYAITDCATRNKSGVLSGSCSNIFRSNLGDQGTVFAKVGADMEGRLVLCPYSKWPGEGRINPPNVGECASPEMEKARQIKQAAENGDMKAQTALGLMYKEGRNTRQDTVEALKWFHLAAEKGDVEALYQLGMEYKRNRNGDEAIRHFKLAAAQGHTGAMFEIGWMLEHGNFGMKSNAEEAEKWYRLAAEKENWHAKILLQDREDRKLKALKKQNKEKWKRRIIWGFGILAVAGLIAAALIWRSKSRRRSEIRKQRKL